MDYRDLNWCPEEGCGQQQNISQKYSDRCVVGVLGNVKVAIGHELFVSITG
jgi:hypothetical protein